jgi:hypothetical protein
MEITNALQVIAGRSLIAFTAPGTAP